MKITIVNKSIIPAFLYGGTERVIWYLGKELAKMGHSVTYLVSHGSHCDFAKICFIDENKSLNSQIPGDTDIVHFNFPVKEKILKPSITTIHGNSQEGDVFDKNTVFVSKNHAERHGSNSFVYNGLDWDDYKIDRICNEKLHFHFLANAAWKVKNLKGAIGLVKSVNENLAVLGGKRLNFKMGFRFTSSRKVRFYGMLGGLEKFKLISKSKGLIFPVLWDEPFGLAIIESMFFACPVFGTPYGSLPELVKPEFGLLSTKKEDLSKALLNYSDFNSKLISEYAIDSFNSKLMAEKYLKKYEKVISGSNLNEEMPKYLVEKNKKNFILS
ncbi:MAG: glycosyltransferase family 4 protein [Bacteroidales bacterium]|jgi:glycosyltransferase involved in cell wall biosynthesis|nr:glycosyltransferase [Bacteroidales bacterium]NLB86432.1 glycosyltransferase family 4 protein [Bacteroidales bacterium]